MIDSILFVLLGISVIGLAVWGGFVAVDALPDSQKKNRRLHLWMFGGFGLAAVFLTVITGFRNYYAQKDNTRQQGELSTELQAQTGLLAQAKASLEQVQIAQAKQQGRDETLTQIISQWNNDNNKSMKEVLSRSANSPTITNRFRAMSPQELKNEAIAVSRQIRGIESSINSSISALSEGWVKLKTPQEREEYSSRITQLYASVNPQYQSCCKDLAITLREEIIGRQNGDAASGDTLFRYENPTNPLGLEAMASDLEKLALSIPDKPKPHR